MTTLDVTYWMRLLGMVAGEAACVVGLIFLADRLVKSGFWRRSLWRMGMACLMVVIASELTGFGRGMAVWTRRAAKVAPAARAQVSVDYVALPPGSVSAGQAAMPPVMAVPSVEKVKATKTLWLPGLIWLAGFVLVVGRMAAAQIFMGVLQWRRTALQGTGLNRRVTALLGQMGSKLRVRLLETPGLVCPAAFGIVRPTIALPDGFEKWFTPAQQDVMLAHELAHLAARDPLWYFLADLASALLWWHPAVWWARRQLHNNSELAADEATAILPDGPSTLAECLVYFGKEISGGHNWGWMGVSGNGFRSSLGKRVERLVKLGDGVRTVPGSWRMVFIKVVSGVFLTGLIVMGTGWVQSESQRKADSWDSTLRQSWNSSPASMVLLAALEPKQPAEPRAVEPPEVKTAPANLTIDPTADKPADQKSEPPPPPSSNGISDEVIDLISFQNTPLSELLKTVTQQAKVCSCSNIQMFCDSVEVANYPITFSAKNISLCDRKLLDFTVKGCKQPIEYTLYPNLVVFSAKKPGPEELVNRNYRVTQEILAALRKIDPNIGDRSDDLVSAFGALALSAGVNLKPAGRGIIYDARAKQLIIRTILKEQAVIKNLLEHGLNVGLPQQAETKPAENAAALYTRTFKITPEALTDALKQTGVSVNSTNLNEAMRQFLKSSGLIFDDPGKVVYFNDRRDVLLARATFHDLNLIENALQRLNVRAPQMTIEAKFYEVEESSFGMPVTVAGSAAEFARMTNRPPYRFQAAFLPYTASGVEVSGILTASELRVVERGIEQRVGMEMLSVPKVTTLNGRQAHASVVDMATVHTNGNPNTVATTVAVGPTIDVLPEVAEDGFSIRLTVIASMTELLDPSGKKWKSSPPEIALPLTRQLFTSCNVWDGQTLVLGGKMSNEKPGNRKRLFVFVTARLIDSAGNVLHADSDLVFAEKTIPPQRAK